MAKAAAYEAETEGVLVRVRPAFIEQESSPEDDKFLWAYHVEIENRGGRTLQLMTRHWRITDGDVSARGHQRALDAATTQQRQRAIRGVTFADAAQIHMHVRHK